MPAPNFPGPYVNSVKENDPMIIRSDLDVMGIGARRSSGLPKDEKSPDMNIQHVGGTTGGGR